MQRKFDLDKCRASIQERMLRIERRLKDLHLNWTDLEPLSKPIKPEPMIFLGPSLPLDRAKAILSGNFRGPIARGDLIRALEEGYRIFGIIDGVFHQNLTVGIEEIRYALESGANLYGASSMGALRAAETYPLGMVGIGQIYRWYRDETVDSDDEVAVCFEEGTAKGLSEPSVNLRATLNFLRKSGRLSMEAEKQILETYLAMHFSNRNLSNLAKALQKDFPQAEDWSSLIQEHWIDQKANDAVDLLTTIRDTHVTKTS